MHRMLKEGVPVRANLKAQQRSYDAFREEYNWARSHEALQRRTPGSVYYPSKRSFPEKLPEVEYESGVTVRMVRHNGEIKWRSELIYVSEVLAKEPLGLKPVGNDKWELRYSFHVLGLLDEQTNRIIPAKGWHGSKSI